MGIRITTWNVNGIKNPFGYAPWNRKRTFEAMFDILEADILVLQECKIQPKDLDDSIVLVPGWDSYFSLPVHRKGYSGVAIYTRQSRVAPIRAEQGITGVVPQTNSSTSYLELPSDKQIGGYPSLSQLAEVPINGEVDPKLLDSEGRCVILEFPAFVLIGTYIPADSDGSRPEFRKAFLHAVDCRIRNLTAMGKRVIWTGDLNMTRAIVDSADYREHMKKGKVTMDEYLNGTSRRLFNQLLVDGDILGSRDQGREKGVLVDVPRIFHPGRLGMYTHWDTKKNLRPANFGSRIDHILASESMSDWFEDSNIQEGLAGSDHCPVYAIFKDRIIVEGKDVAALDLLNPGGDFNNGIRQKPYGPGGVPGLSGRLVYKEFCNRQSIKTMFMAKKPLVRSESGTSASNIPNSLPPIVTARAEDSMDPTQPSTLTPGPIDSPRPLPTAVQPLQPAIEFQKPTSSPAAAASFESKKRKASEMTSSAVKKPKAKKDDMKGQGKLSTFFTAKTPAANGTLSAATATPSLLTPKSPSPSASPAQAVSQSTTATPPPPSTPQASTPSNNRSLPPPTDGPSDPLPPPPPSPKLIDPIVSKESWSALMRAPAPPLCDGHQEPCPLWTTKKKGPNQGRRFFMCPRDIGPSGKEEKGSEWRCGTFVWKSDWNPGGGGGGG